MFSRTFHPDRFLQRVYGSEPFARYCHERGIPFDQVRAGVVRSIDLQRWNAALAQLPREQHVQIGMELAKVNEMAHMQAIPHLLVAVEGRELPGEDIPGGPALALWFLLRYPDIFHRVFLHLATEETESWQNAQFIPGVAWEAVADKGAELAASVQEYFARHDGIGRFCTASVYRMHEAYCFTVYLADRPRLFESFTDEGEFAMHRLRPAVTSMFVYYPQDGMVLFKAHVCPHRHDSELLRRFGMVVLGMEMNGQSLGHSFRLDLFKQRFAPLSDAADMELVRVKALHLIYPSRLGRRQVKLETLESDAPFAILELLAEHGGEDGTFGQLDVLHVELQIMLRVNGWTKNHFIRLWRNRCNLSQTELGTRFRTCLRTWGILHAG